MEEEFMAKYYQQRGGFTRKKAESFLGDPAFAL